MLPDVRGARDSAEVEERNPVTTAIKKIKPGDPCHTNNDGVTACNTGSTNDGNIAIHPQSGSGSSKTTVGFKNDAEGTVTGIDGNDTVNTAHGSDPTISGTGGTVNADSGSTGSVTNTNPAGGGGASITVNIGGGSVTVPPGGTVNFAG